MKIKLLMTLAAGILAAVFLYISLTAKQDSATDKCASFGLGATAVIFVSGLITAIKGPKSKVI
ncbi:MAG TPA: hypothetical protein VHS53_18730 [Mucilaginibacter sp.]|nr:hypothetical protein [Mucilaginibacter sp.]